MDIRELRYFIAVAELRSFTKAGNQLRIAQPALSRQVRKLEDELGVQLLQRLGRGIDLTDAGRQLLKKAYIVLDQIEDIKFSALAIGNRVSGLVTLGVTPAAGEVLVPPVLIKLSDTYPDIRIDVVEGFSGFLYERLLNHDLSIAILHNPVPHRDLKIAPLLIEDMYLIGPPQTRRGLVPPAQLDDISGVPLILPNQPHSLRVLVESQMAKHGLNVNVIRQVDGLVVLRSMLRAALGYSILTYGSIHRDVEAGILAVRKLDQPPINWRMCMVSHRNSTRQDAIDPVCKIIQSEVDLLIDKGVWRGNTHITH
jgi:LysR family nitrogen assimilation transcriptional regulator